MESITGESPKERSLNGAEGDWELSGSSVNRPPSNTGLGTLEEEWEELDSCSSTAIPSPT